jgi:hypothetical protein
MFLFYLNKVLNPAIVSRIKLTVNGSFGKVTPMGMAEFYKK